MSEPIVKKIDLADKRGVVLKTEKCFCQHNILVLPKLNPLEIVENGTYPVPLGFAGNGQVKVNVQPKKETALIINANGTYTAQPGTVYTSIIVNVPTGTTGGGDGEDTGGGDTGDSGGSGDTGDSSHIHKYTSVVTPPTCTAGGYTTHTCECGYTYTNAHTAPTGHHYVDGICQWCGAADPTYVPDEPEIDTGSFSGIVGDTFSVNYEGSSPEVYWPTCLSYQDDGGVLIFTAIASGSGVIRLTRYDELIAEYTVVVNVVESYDYDLEMGDTFSIQYEGSSPTVICPTCLSYQDDGGVLVFTAEVIGSGTLQLYQSDSLIAAYTVSVKEQQSDSDTHIHSFTSEITPPTCTETGYTTHTCAECGYSYKDTPVAAHHISGEPVLVREATCTVPPEYVISCTRCGAELSRYEDDGAFAEHVENEGMMTKAATCTASGIYSYYCAVCGAWMRDKTLPPAGHAYVSEVTDPTCTEEGYTTHTCTKCGHTYTSGKVAALWHTPGEAVLERKATCTKPAEYATYCIRCGIEYARWEDDGEFAPHIADGGTVTKEPTCVATGIRKYYCRECSTWVKDEVIPATGNHTYKAVVTAPTCTASGFTTHTCSVCGDSYTDSETEATGHNFASGWKTVTAATCIHKGKEKRVCLTCGHTEERETAATGVHTYKAVVTAPTCTERGYTTHTCTVCGVSYTDSETEATGHNFSSGWFVAIAAACETQGTEKRVCLTCGHAETRAIPAKGHTWSDPYESDEFSTGYGKKCTACGELHELAMPECEHVNYTTKITTQPTCVKDGVKTFTCSKCGDTWTETVKATGIHDYVAVVTAPTCTLGGYTTHTCSMCHDTYRDSETEPSGHNFASGWVIDKAPTCDQAGSKHRTCLTCGYTETVSIAATGHAYAAVVTAPTCTAKGYTTHTCSKCGDSYKTNEIPATGHKEGDPVLEREATCTVAPEYATYCTVCGIEMDRWENDGELAEHISDGGRTTKAATCTEDGVMTHRCRTCNTWLKDVVLPALGHDEGDPELIREPTCTTPAEYATYCTRCSWEIDRWEDDGEFADHVEDGGSVTREPDCTTRGIITYRCRECDTWLREEYIDALGHAFRDPEPDPSVSSGTSITCERCGHTEEY